MHRRTFLGSLFGSALAPVLSVSTVAAIAPDVLRLWGDGKHDDGPALRALLARGSVYLPPGSYLVRA